MTRSLEIKRKVLAFSTNKNLKESDILNRLFARPFNVARICGFANTSPYIITKVKPGNSRPLSKIYGLVQVNRNEFAPCRLKRCRFWCLYALLPENTICALVGNIVWPISLALVVCQKHSCHRLKVKSKVAKADVFTDYLTLWFTWRKSRYRILPAVLSSDSLVTWPCFISLGLTPPTTSRGKWIVPPAPPRGAAPRTYKTKW